MEHYTDARLEGFPPPRHPLLIVISGPSGVGKDAVLRRLKARGADFHFVVTATTRPPRPGERHGVDYYFVSTEEFQRMIAQGELMEWSIVYGDYKGVPVGPIRDALRRGQDVIMRIDVQGAAKVRALCPDAVLIFLMAESLEVLEHRLRERGTESGQDLQTRLEMMEKELARLPEFDYLVINREGALDETVDQILAIVAAEHLRVRHRKPCAALLRSPSQSAVQPVEHRADA